jgi:large subunit ribosomal protein L32
MAHPKSRISKQRKRKRRTHYKITDTPNIVSCASCGAPKLRHTICGECGVYRGRTIIKQAEEISFDENVETTIDDVTVDED